MDPYLKIFENIYEEFGDAVFRYLFVRLSNRERALEITQEVFMRIWSYVSSGREIQNVRAFVFRAAHNAFVNEIRVNRKSVSLDALIEEGFEPRQETDEMSEKEMRESQEELIEKVKELPDEHKEILILRYVEDLTIPEISEVLDVTENHASVRIHRAKQKLKEIYERH